MKATAIILGLGGILLVLSAIALGAWAGMPANPLAVLGILLSQAGPLAKLVLLWLAVLAVVIAIMGAARRARGGRSGNRSRLTVLSVMAPGLGLASTVLSCLTIRGLMERTGVSDLRIIAPSLAEAIMPLGLGLLVGAAAALEGLAAARSARSPA